MKGRETFSKWKSLDFLINYNFFLDNGKIVLIPVLALKEDTTVMALTSMKVTTIELSRPLSEVHNHTSINKHMHQKCTSTHR
jgi:hypothetical protein